MVRLDSYSRRCCLRMFIKLADTFSRQVERFVKQVSRLETWSHLKGTQAGILYGPLVQQVFEKNSWIDIHRGYLN